MTIEEMLEGKTQEEMIQWFKTTQNLSVGRAYNMGRVEVLLDEGYTTEQMCEKLGLNESAIRAIIGRIQKKRELKQ